jgi:hypothetical protein
MYRHHMSTVLATSKTIKNCLDSAGKFYLLLTELTEKPPSKSCYLPFKNIEWLQGSEI